MIRMKTAQLYSLAIILVMIISAPVFAQSDSSSAINPFKFLVKVKPDTARIGDNIEVTVKVTYPDSLELTKPSVKPGDDIVVKGEPEVKSKSERGKKIDTYKYKMTSFATGEVELPLFEFYYYDSEGNQNSRIAPIETVHIGSVLPAEVKNDTTQVPIKNKDIIPPKGLPIIWWPYAVGVAVIILLIAVYWYFFKYRVKLMNMPEIPPEPPFDVAIRRLHDLESQDLPGKGKCKQFYIELTEIIRHYIDGRFEIAAAESTTYELKRILKHHEINREQTKVIFELLTRADMIKFAKQEPHSEEPPRDFVMVKNFVVDSKPVEIIEENDKPEVSS